MSSKAQIQALTTDRGLKTFRFTLSESSEGVKVLKNSPDGWADAETTYTRHKKYGSVLRNTSTNELIFYKEGKRFLQNCYENSGIDCNATMLVEKLDKTTNTYATYPAAGKFDFSTYQVDEVSVKIQMIDTSFKEKVINRATTEVDILGLQSIGSEAITVDVFPVREITIPDTSIDLTDIATINGITLTDGDVVVPITGVTNADFTAEMRVPVGADPDHVDGSFFYQSAQPRVIHLTGDNDLELTGSYVNFTVVHFNLAGTVKNEYGIYTPSSYPGSSPYSFSFTINKYITLETGDSLCFKVNFTGTRLATTSSQIIPNEVYTGSPEITTTALPYYETFLRIGQLITDSNNPFKSDFFGRTDTPLTTYGSDGEIGFATRGIYLRDFSGGVTEQIPVKLSDFFDSLSSIFRLGLGVETIGGVDKIVVEELDYFYDASVIIDISDKLRAENIEKHVIPEMFYKSIEAGYNKSEYDNNAGLFEFNTKNTWTTVIKSVFNDLKKISKYRADGQGMRLIMLAPEQDDYDSTKDVKGDSDIFLIDALRDGSDFIARTDEDFTYVGGSVYAGSSFNIRYSPGRMLRNWGANIRAGLIHSLNSYLRWQSAEKNTTLVSKYTGESSNIVENADILANDLDAPRFYNEKYIVKAPLTVAELNEIDTNPDGLIKIANTIYKADGITIKEPAKYGWVLPGGSIKTSNKDGMAEFELLRCNLDNVTPVELLGTEGGDIVETEGGDERITEWEQS